MKKLSFIIVALLLAGSFCWSSPLVIGDKVKNFDLEVWYQNKPAPLKKWLGKKTVALLFITTAVPDPGTLLKINKMATLMKKNDVEIALIANGLPKNSTNVPGWKNLQLPVAFDLKSKLFKQLGGNFAKIPFWAVITPERELAWRGKVNMLPAFIGAFKSGKYKVSDAARREAFTTRLTGLMKNRKYLEAVNLITEEQKFDAANQELLNLKCNLLLRRLKQPAAAVAEVDRAIKAAPQNFNLYDFKLVVQRQAQPDKPELPIFQEMIRRFGDKPALLMGEVKKEMSRPLESMNPEGVYLLAQAAASAKKFRNRNEKGMAHLAYARILHYCGRPDLAVKEAETAEKLLTGKQKKMAESIRKHFAEIAGLSSRIRKAGK